MRAALLVDFDAPLAIERIDPIPLGPHDVRVRIDASGVCHSDVGIASGKHPLPLPMVLGHEGAGTVVEVGGSVTRVKPGDRVISVALPSCGDCWFCVHDQPAICAESGNLVMRQTARKPQGDVVRAMCGLGTFADEMVAYESSLVPVVTDLPADQLALIGCGITTGVGAVLNTAGVEAGATVAVVGCGGVGQAVVQGARVAGASRIIAVDPVAFKRSTAMGFGATDAVDPHEGDPVAQVKDLTHGLGVDYAFEVIGLSSTIQQAYSMLHNGGSVVVVGWGRSDDAVSWPTAEFSHAKRIIGCNYGSTRPRIDFPRYVDLAENGRIDLASMVTRRIGLDDVNDAFRAMEAGEVIRSVIV
jgi:S-(hydroxymethyl)glutathione dehydrogenase/alcohol dehydrogenase